MRRIWLAAAVFSVLFLVGFAAARVENHRPPVVNRAQIMLGTVVEIEVHGLSEASANQAINAAFAEIQRVENQLNGATHFENGALIPPTEIDTLLLACDEFWHLSNGAFDCNLGAVIALWGFTNRTPSVPPDHVLAESRRNSGWQVFTRSGEGAWWLSRTAKVNIGGIGKGYAVDRAIAVLAVHGVRKGLVNAGGDLRTIGSPWTAGIQHPRQPDLLVGKLAVNDMAVATSGDYEQYFIHNGLRYHHILDPHTGQPARGLQSVTVIAPTCIQADALSTAIFVLGKDAGLAFVESLPDVEALLIAESGEKHFSSGFGFYWQGE